MTTEEEDEAYIQACLLTEMRIVYTILNNTHATTEADRRDISLAIARINNVTRRIERATGVRDD